MSDELDQNGPEDGPGQVGSDAFEEYQDLMDEWFLKGIEKNGGLSTGISTVQVQKRTVTSQIQPDQEEQQVSSYEKAIMQIDCLRDSLIESFHKYKSNKVVFDVLEDAIHKVEETIRSLGGDTEEFDPLTCMSGLKTPPEYTGGQESEIVLSNANTVISNTKKLYSVHNISSIQAKIIKEKPGIVFQIDGDENGSPFRVVGAIVAKENFFGNEAIDYVRHNGKGALSIKAFSNGNWVDVGHKFHLGVEERPL